MCVFGWKLGTAIERVCVCLCVRLRVQFYNSEYLNPNRMYISMYAFVYLHHPKVNRLGLHYLLFILITDGKQTFHFSKTCQNGVWRVRQVSGPPASLPSTAVSSLPWIDPAAGHHRLDPLATTNASTRALHRECSVSTVPHWFAIQKLYSDSDILGNCLTKVQQDLTSNRFSRAWTRDYLLKL